MTNNTHGGGRYLSLTVWKIVMNGRCIIEHGTCFLMYRLCCDLVYWLHLFLYCMLSTELPGDESRF